MRYLSLFEKKSRSGPGCLCVTSPNNLLKTKNIYIVGLLLYWLNYQYTCWSQCFQVLV
jgi:hypothetical protein